MKVNLKHSEKIRVIAELRKTRESCKNKSFKKKNETGNKCKTVQQNMVKLKKDLYGKIKITWISRKVKTIRRSKARKIQRGTNNNGKQNKSNKIQEWSREQDKI